MWQIDLIAFVQKHGAEGLDIVHTHFCFLICRQPELSKFLNT